MKEGGNAEEIKQCKKSITKFEPLLKTSKRHSPFTISMQCKMSKGYGRKTTRCKSITKSSEDHEDEKQTNKQTNKYCVIGGKYDPRDQNHVVLEMPMIQFAVPLKNLVWRKEDCGWGVEELAENREKKAGESHAHFALQH